MDDGLSWLVLLTLNFWHGLHSQAILAYSLHLLRDLLTQSLLLFFLHANLFETLALGCHLFFGCQSSNIKHLLLLLLRWLIFIRDREAIECSSIQEGLFWVWNLVLSSRWRHRGSFAVLLIAFLCLITHNYINDLLLLRVKIYRFRTTFAYFLGATCAYHLIFRFLFCSS